VTVGRVVKAQVEGSWGTVPLPVGEGSVAANRGLGAATRGGLTDAWRWGGLPEFPNKPRRPMFPSFTESSEPSEQRARMINDLSGRSILE